MKVLSLMLFTMFTLFTLLVPIAESCRPCGAPNCYMVGAHFGSSHYVAQYAMLYISIPPGKLTIGPTPGLRMLGDTTNGLVRLNVVRFPAGPVVTASGPIVLITQNSSGITYPVGRIEWHATGQMIIMMPWRMSDDTLFGWMCADLYYSVPTIAPVPTEQPSYPTIAPPPTDVPARSPSSRTTQDPTTTPAPTIVSPTEPSLIAPVAVTIAAVPVTEDSMASVIGLVIIIVWTGCAVAMLFYRTRSQGGYPMPN